MTEVFTFLVEVGVTLLVTTGLLIWFMPQIYRWFIDRMDKAMAKE